MLIIISIIAIGLIIFAVFKFKDRSKFVNLDLPSGTLWANENMKGQFSGLYSVTYFANMLPNPYQWEELREYCTWTWVNNGYYVCGRNGKSIFLTAEGETINTEMKFGKGVKGSYMVYTGSNNSTDRFVFTKNHTGLENNYNTYASVRLVRQK